jgi:hypothetical protein
MKVETCFSMTVKPYMSAKLESRLFVMAENGLSITVKLCLSI